MNISEYIFDFFNKKGVEAVFMVTGGQAMYLNDAVGKNKNYSIICHHHEQACSMSADAYGRIKNKPAIALVTAGPGSVNAMNGVVGAYTDSSPMIVISGQANLAFVQYEEKTRIRQYGIQGINIRSMVEGFVKYFKTIDDVTKVNYYLEEAWEAATTGRPGPVWIDVPLDIQRAEFPSNQVKFGKKIDLSDLYRLDLAVNSILEHLKTARRPLWLAGQGVSLSGARESFIKLFDTAGVPVITARLGIDLIESDNELYVGRPGNYGERAANLAIQNADLIVSLGCRLASSLVGHSPEKFGKHAYKIVVDVDREELDKPGVVIDEKVMLDCKEIIDELNSRISARSLPKYSEWVQQCNSWKSKYPVVQPEYKDEKPVNSYYFVDRLSALAPDNANIMVDTGSCFHVVCQTWKIKRGQHFLTTGGLSSMGYWCAGIGVCIANDRKDTIVITGDGSLQMNIQEFAPIHHNSLPIKTFVLNNNGYLLIRSTQHNFMEDRFVGEGPNSGVWCPELERIAAAYEIPYVRIENVDEIDDKVKRVFATNGPVICEVMTPEWQALVPRITSEKTSDGRLVAHEYSDMFPFLSREEYKQNMIAEE
ncbi:MAG: thiamine pyrophosphate-binding protein [Alphaproteobacteria bacterium]|nr:thiamine pyrophosphate-binding protein [Alphaproteobacteria bacterium]